MCNAGAENSCGHAAVGCAPAIAVGRRKPFHPSNNCIVALLRPLTAIVSAGGAIMHVILPDDSEAYAGP